jgi:hypothetical protein
MVIAMAQRDGSLFDLQRDSAADIVAVIARKGTPNKARDISTGLAKLLLKQPKPAG